MVWPFKKRCWQELRCLQDSWFLVSLGVGDVVGCGGDGDVGNQKRDDKFLWFHGLVGK